MSEDTLAAWRSLLASHRAPPSEHDAVKGVRRRLQRLGDHHGVVGASPHRFTHKAVRGRREYFLGGGALSLPPSHDIVVAELLVRFIVERSEVVQFDVRLDARGAGRQPLVVAVHRDPEPRGHGACGHALVHCHVAPNLDDLPKVRVPFPHGDPLAALDWVLVIAIPGWEPAPWAALKP